MIWLLSGERALAAADAGGPQTKNQHIPTAFNYVKTGDLDKAEAELARARAYDDFPPKSDSAQIYILEGMLKTLSGDGEKARTAFRNALWLDPQATLPEWVKHREIRRTFDAIRAEPQALPSTEAPAHGSSTGRNFATEVEKFYSKGRLDAAEKFLSMANPQGDIEQGQVQILSYLVGCLRSLQEGAPPDQHRLCADSLGTAETVLSEEFGKRPHTREETARFIALCGSLLIAKGVLRVESGEEKAAKASFRKALEVNPCVKLPSVASNAARRFFDGEIVGETKAARGVCKR